MATSAEATTESGGSTARIRLPVSRSVAQMSGHGSRSIFCWKTPKVVGDSRSIVDVYSTYDDIPANSEGRGRVGATPDLLLLYKDGEDGDSYHERCLSCTQSISGCGLFARVWKLFANWHPTYWLLLTLLGFVTASIAYALDVLVVHTFEKREEHDAAVFLLSAASLGLIATLTVYYISPAAAGSGIPELKVILAGDHVHDFLAPKTLLAKVIGMWAGLSASFSIGSEGPFVHIAACVASILCSVVPCFHRYFRIDTYRLQILAVAVSAGVTATFGAPVGGVIFSIEVTATFFFVSNLWRGFYTAICCMLFFRLVRQLDLVELFDVDHLPEFDVSFELIAFSILGWLCGMLAGAFVHSLAVISAGVKLLPRWARIVQAPLIAVLLAGITLSFPVMKQQAKGLIAELFNPDNAAVDPVVNSHGTLWLLLFLQAFAILASLSCAIPSGVFTPVFLLGAAIGRLYGVYVNDMEIGASSPALYAVVGAVCLTAGVTRTVSVSVIAFELIGQIHHMSVVLIATLIAYITSSAFSCSVYDVLLHQKGLPFLPHLRQSRTYYLSTARDICLTCPCISLESTETLLDSLNAAKQLPRHCAQLPLVEHHPQEGTRRFVGSVAVEALLKEVEDVVADARVERERHLNRQQGGEGPENGHTPVVYSRQRTKRSLLYSSAYLAPRRFPCLSPEDEAVLAGTPLNLSIDDKSNGDPSVLAGLVDWAPLSAQDRQPVARVQYLFTMLRLKQIFVVDREGNLSGVITKNCFNSKEVAQFLSRSKTQEPDRDFPMRMCTAPELLGRGDRRRRGGEARMLVGGVGSGSEVSESSSNPNDSRV